MEDEGIVFQCNTEIGKDLTLEELQESFDAVLLAIGSKVPRDIPAQGRGTGGVHFAMDFLTQNNKAVAGEHVSAPPISAEGKTVLVIGGGDTGSDCIGTSLRQGAKRVIQATIEAKPPVERADTNPWPQWPQTLKTSSSHEEGCERHWGLNAVEVVADADGQVEAVVFDKVESKSVDGRWAFVPTGEQVTMKCDLVLLAIGFVHPEHAGVLENAEVKLDDRGNIATTGFRTNRDGLFAAGDARRGQSLVVWAIAEGRRAAKAIDGWLLKESS